MNFQEMYSKVKDGYKARRKSWREGEYLYWTNNYLVHNTPYFNRDIPVCIGQEPSYYYVVEKDDPTAKDWEVL